jgi:hypothetical protein
MTNSKSQINLNFQAQMTKTILSEILNFGHFCLPVGGGAYLEFGLPARSPALAGRRQVLGICCFA